MDAVTRAKSATEGGGGMELEEMKGRPESDIEWYVERAQDPERRHFVEVFMRMRAMYRVGYGRMTQEVTELLGKMTTVLCNCEREAMEKGMELAPLSSVELECAFPFRDGEINAVGYGLAAEQDGKNELGLRAALRREKGCPLRVWIKNLRHEIRYALQRAWRGYDDADVFDLGFNLAQRMPVLLREFKKHNDLLFRDPITKRDFSREETDHILERMTFCFENCDAGVVYRRLFGISCWEDEYCEERVEAAQREMRKCRAEALGLLSKWCFSLWY